MTDTYMYTGTKDHSKLNLYSEKHVVEEQSLSTTAQTSRDYTLTSLSKKLLLQ